MRYLVLSMLCLMAACGGKVEGDPWSGKAERAVTTMTGQCQQVRGSKYMVCGVIDGDIGITASTNSTGTTYAVRGASYAR